VKTIIDFNWALQNHADISNGLRRSLCHRTRVRVAGVCLLPEDIGRSISQYLGHGIRLCGGCEEVPYVRLDHQAHLPCSSARKVTLRTAAMSIQNNLIQKASSQHTHTRIRRFVPHWHLAGIDTHEHLINLGGPPFSITGMEDSSALRNT
jgi:hypothetical protein